MIVISIEEISNTLLSYDTFTTDLWGLPIIF